MTFRHRFSGLLMLTFLLLTGCASHQALKDSLVGSQWKVVYDNPTFGHREYTITLHANGKLTDTHPNEKTPDDDKWVASEQNIELNFNNGYAVYTGVISADGMTMSGKAASPAGGEWNWRATRITGAENGN